METITIMGSIPDLNKMELKEYIKKHVEYEIHFMKKIIESKLANFLGDFRLVLVIWDKSPFDVENAAKTVLEGLIYSNIIENINQCSEMAVKKVISEKPPQISFGLYPVHENYFSNN